VSGGPGVRELEGHVRALAEEIGERHVWRYDALERAATYIEDSLRSSLYDVVPQAYEVDIDHPLLTPAQRGVHNLEVEVGGRGRAHEIVVIGAHYDSIPGCPAANDNGSGVAAMLEIARLLADRTFERTLRFVAFVNEEPPFFQTSRMGSMVYARRCRQRREKVVAMISLETIGYYSDEPASQRYPFPFSLFYPSVGNFIGFIGNLASRRLVRRVVSSFREHTSFPCEGAAVPGWITGIGWSDHWAFWKAGYPALMATDTALFRYPWYHTPQDTVDKIDFERMALVVAGLANVVEDLAQ
jgi:Zn-dependent M28 family amino/carboxypeptidase